MGLAFLISPGVSFALFAGSVVALIAGKVGPNWSAYFLIIAGESLAGMCLALLAIFNA